MINNEDSASPNDNSDTSNKSSEYFDYFSLFVMPRFRGHQLLGDSIFVRFADHVLDQHYTYVEGKPNKIGYCVSGQRIKQLALNITKGYYPLHERVIVLIGTNDVLAGRSISDMIKDYNNLILLLESRRVKNIIILTLPPVPRIALTRKHWEVVRAFNAYLIGLAGGASAINTIDILPLFVKFDVPAIAAPPVTRSTASFSLYPSTPKRKIAWDTDVSTTPKRKRTIQDPTLTSEDDAKCTPFGRYLNRINRLEAVESRLESEDDEENLQYVKPYIDYGFWREIQTSLQQNPREDYEAPLPTEDTTPRSSSSMMSPAVPDWQRQFTEPTPPETPVAETSRPFLWPRRITSHPTPGTSHDVPREADSQDPEGPTSAIAWCRQNDQSTPEKAVTGVTPKSSGHRRRSVYIEDPGTPDVSSVVQDWLRRNIRETSRETPVTEVSSMGSGSADPEVASSVDWRQRYVDNTLETPSPEPSSLDVPDWQRRSVECDGHRDEFPSNLPDNHKLIIQNTNKFLRLNYYEMVMGAAAQQRMDMIHPNSLGLRRIRDYLEKLLEKEK